MDQEKQDVAYRVLEREHADSPTGKLFTLIAVRYEDGRISDTSDPDQLVGPVGTDVESLRTNHAQLMQAFEAPVLHTSDIPGHDDYVSQEDRERYENPEDGEIANSPEVLDAPVDTDTADSLPGQPHVDGAVDPSTGATAAPVVGEGSDHEEDADEAFAASHEVEDLTEVANEAMTEHMVEPEVEPEPEEEPAKKSRKKS